MVCFLLKETPMTPENEFSKIPPETAGKIENIFLSSNNMIAIYTVLSILVKMRQHLGLEAMLEYIKRYLETIEKHEPSIKDAVSHAVGLISIEKIYSNARKPHS